MLVLYRLCILIPDADSTTLCISPVHALGPLPISFILSEDGLDAKNYQVLQR